MSRNGNNNDDDCLNDDSALIILLFYYSIIIIIIIISIHSSSPYCSIYDLCVSACDSKVRSKGKMKECKELAFPLFSAEKINIR